MEFKERIDSFLSLGKVISDWLPGNQSKKHTLTEAVSRSYANNSWFTHENQVMALKAISLMISEDSLKRWLSDYNELFSEIKTPKAIAVVMAGNIPLVGFHDLLCVLLSGHKIVMKCSKDDPYLIPALVDLLKGIDSRWSERIVFTDGPLKNFDAIIATGGNNTSRYFEYYFGKVPHIIRHHRNSIAVLTGSEDEKMLQGLAGDVLSYFGLGCRNVSKIYVPVDYDFTKLRDAFVTYQHYLHHHKFRNNFEYNKSLLMLNQIPYYELSPLLLMESDKLSSRIAVLHYSYYNEIEEVIREISDKKDELQCIVSHRKFLQGVIEPGRAQYPGPEEYADGVDTLRFLSGIE